MPAFGYINNQDHRLVEPGQIFDERDTSDRVHVLLSGVARITCRNRKAAAQWLSCCARNDSGLSTSGGRIL